MVRTPYDTSRPLPRLPKPHLKPLNPYKRAREGGMMNSWPGGVRRALTQDQHACWNASNYPGTRQLCSECESETGRCEEDAVYVGDRGPLCDECEGGRDHG